MSGGATSGAASGTGSSAGSGVGGRRGTAFQVKSEEIQLVIHAQKAFHTACMRSIRWAQQQVCSAAVAAIAGGRGWAVFKVNASVIADVLFRKR